MATIMTVTLGAVTPGNVSWPLNPAMDSAASAAGSVVRDESDVVIADYSKLVVGGDSTYYHVFPDVDGLGLFTPLAQQQGPLADIDNFVPLAVEFDVAYSGIKVTSRCEALGTLVDDDLRFGIAIGYSPLPAGPNVNMHPFQFSDPAADDYVAVTLFQHANQSGIIESVREWDTTDQPDLATVTDYSQTLGVFGMSLFWQNTNAEAADDGIDIRVHSLVFELIP